jgi:hypothetical protein
VQPIEWGFPMTSLSLRGAAAAFAVACGVSFAAPAFANQAEDRTAAIAACRAEVAEQLSVDADAVRFDQSSTRGSRFDVVFQVRGEDFSGRYACRYSRTADEVVGVASGTRANVGDVIVTATASTAATAN